jgi:hypothetical protein
LGLKYIIDSSEDRSKLWDTKTPITPSAQCFGTAFRWIYKIYQPTLTPTPKTFGTIVGVGVEIYHRFVGRPFQILGYKTPITPSARSFGTAFIWIHKISQPNLDLRRDEELQKDIPMKLKNPKTSD